VSGATSQVQPPISNFADLYFAQAAANLGRESACVSVASRLRDQEQLVADQTAANAFACGEFTDIATAMVGMHPAQVWLTRFELDLPREALSQDCVVVPSESQDSVSNLLLATQIKNRPATCQQPIFESRFAAASPAQARVWLSVLGLTALVWLRRRLSKAGR
jgi:hypothetical protein